MPVIVSDMQGVLSPAALCGTALRLFIFQQGIYGFINAPVWAAVFDGTGRSPYITI
ncbi:MAG: hypothetical protein MR018_08305 [Clostridiales bacterium]|nr:hypothetical protein [Clostridiales bacterium]